MYFFLLFAVVFNYFLTIALKNQNKQEEDTWRYSFEGEFQWDNASKLQDTLRRKFRMYFQDVALGGNIIRVEKGCYRVVIVGTFGLFHRFKLVEQGFREALQEEEDEEYKLPPGVNAMVGARAQLDSLMYTIRCPKAVAQRLQMGVQNLQPEVAEWVRQLRANDESLTEISVGRELGPDLRCEDAHALAEALKVNSTLRDLSLWRCTGIGNAGWVALADALKVNSTLRMLRLACTGIGNAECVARP